MKLPAMPAQSDEMMELEARSTRFSLEQIEAEEQLKTLLNTIARSQDSDALDEQARLMADGGDEPPSHEVSSEKLRLLRVRLELLNRTCGQLQARVFRERERFARQCAATLRPVHEKATKEIARCLVALVRANDQEEQVRRALPGNPLVSMSFPNCGRFCDSGSRATYWLAHAQRCGFLTAAERAELMAPE